MRTTLELDDDVLASARDIAKRDGTTAGRVISDLARRALTHGVGAQNAPVKGAPRKTGFTPFASRGSVVTNELIDRLSDDGEY